MSGQRRTVVVLVVLGAIALVVGVIYLIEPAKSLPSFIPGQVAHATVHRYKRGIGAVVLGLVLLGAALYTRRREPPPPGSPPAPA